MPSRRRAIRRPRRVQVHFWRQGDPTAYIGYTTNISLTGMFVATNSPLSSGSRVRIEVADRDRGFMVEGVVAHARKSPLELARLSQSGMGIRFLTVEELVRELMPAGLAETEEIPQAAAPSPEPPPLVPPPPLPDLTQAFPTPPSRPAPPPPPRAPRAPEPAAAPPSPRPVVLVPPPPLPPRRPPVPVETTGGSFTVRFSGVEEFLEVYRRDILQGGLFVSTRYPARLQETVSVELYPPGLVVDPVLVRARVVQRFEPQSESGPNLLSGMGLELLDVPSLLERLSPVIERLRGLQLRPPAV
ncbi:MAG TPA: PilZ domain-containing protein [Thermoanaerobaculia bacterium]|nr:PilZ domain-containing protein [Thermoanaerobaculia bacterium]